MNFNLGNCEIQKKFTEQADLIFTEGKNVPKCLKYFNIKDSIVLKSLGLTFYKINE
jgi:hypothetical protein